MTQPFTGTARRQDGGGQGGAGQARLGEILIGRHGLEPTQLDAALARQPESGRRLGQVLVAQGWASGGAVAGALAQQWGLDLADLERSPPEVGLAEPALAELYLVHRILP